MYIRWFGQSFVEIQAKSPQNGDYTVLIDPFAVKNIGLRQPKMEADIILLTADKLDKKLNVAGDYLLISQPGEYEKKQIFVYGIAELKEGDIPTGRTVYVIYVEGMRIAHLGVTAQIKYNEQQLEHLEGVDILLLPVGGGGGLSAKQAVQVVQQIEPRVIIPINYNSPRLKVKTDKVDSFIKELGKKPLTAVDRLRIVKKDLPAEESRLLLVQP